MLKNWAKNIDGVFDVFWAPKKKKDTNDSAEWSAAKAYKKWKVVIYEKCLLQHEHWEVHKIENINNKKLLFNTWMI